MANRRGLWTTFGERWRNRLKAGGSEHWEGSCGADLSFAPVQRLAAEGFIDRLYK